MLGVTGRRLRRRCSPLRRRYSTSKQDPRHRRGPRVLWPAPTAAAAATRAATPTPRRWSPRRGTSQQVRPRAARPRPRQGSRAIMGLDAGARGQVRGRFRALLRQLRTRPSCVFEYAGPKDCVAAMLLRQQGPEDRVSFACIGLGNCVRACQFGAMHIENGVARSSDREKCAACMACYDACPKKIIQLRFPTSQRVPRRLPLGGQGRADYARCATRAASAA